MDLYTWRVFQQTRNALDVVMVPVCKKGLVDCDVVLSQGALQGLYPCIFAFAGVNQQSLCAGPDNICVGALQGELEL